MWGQAQTHLSRKTLLPQQRTYLTEVTKRQFNPFGLVSSVYGYLQAFSRILEWALRTQVVLKGYRSL